MVFIRTMLEWNANVIVEYDRRRLVLFSAPLDMEYDNNITEE